MENIASLTHSKSKTARVRTLVREVLEMTLLVSLMFIGVRLLLQNFRVEGPSMQPTLTTGQLLWVNKAAYFRWDGQYVLGGPRRGDIAVLHSPEPSDNVDLIKRIIGLPGDRVRVQDGQVFVNDQVLDEPYISFQASYNYPADGRDLTIPVDQYFVLGDNRANSRDSHFGWFVPAENLIGRAWLSYWPPADWGVEPGPVYAGT
jgi:signal peptidase I